MSLLWGAWEEGSEQGDMSVKWEMLGAARKVRAFWNPSSVLPVRLVGTRARVKLAVCVPRMMHTVSWALCSVRHVGAEAAGCSEQAGAALAPCGWWLCAEFPAVPRAGLRHWEMAAGAAAACAGCQGCGLGRKRAVVLWSCSELRQVWNLRHLHHLQWKMCSLEVPDPTGWDLRLIVTWGFS